MGNNDFEMFLGIVRLTQDAQSMYEIHSDVAATHSNRSHLVLPLSRIVFVCHSPSLSSFSFCAVHGAWSLMSLVLFSVFVVEDRVELTRTVHTKANPLFGILVEGQEKRGEMGEKKKVCGTTLCQ